MKKLIIILMTSAPIFLISTLGMATNSSWSLLLQSDNQNSSEKEIALSHLETILCKTAKCDIYKFFPTTQECLDAFDQYFEISDGEMPSCIPRYPEITPDTPFPKNELLGYANWKVLSREQCDPLFDPAGDEFGNPDNLDGIDTLYEICLRNKLAQLDIFVLAMYINCVSDCTKNFWKRCYDKYLRDEDYAAYQECIARTSHIEDKCFEEKCTSYLYQP